MSKSWHWITYYRHRSELWALDLAMRVPLLATFPIFIILMLWGIIAPLPIVLSVFLLFENLGYFGTAILIVLGIPALLVGHVLVAPWFFGWYIIAASLMFGRFTAAKAKEKALLESIRAYLIEAV